MGGNFTGFGAPGGLATGRSGGNGAFPGDFGCGIGWDGADGTAGGGRDGVAFGEGFMCT